MPEEEPETLIDVVNDVAAGPKSTSVDGTSVEQHSLKDLDEIARRQASDRAVRKPHRGLMFNKLVPPGAT